MDANSINVFGDALVSRSRLRLNCVVIGIGQHCDGLGIERGAGQGKHGDLSFDWRVRWAERACEAPEEKQRPTGDRCIKFKLLFFVSL